MENKSMNTQSNKKGKDSPVSNFATSARRSARGLKENIKLLVPVTLIAILIVGIVAGTQTSSSQSSVLTSKCTLSILSGTVEVVIPSVSKTQAGTDGMTLDAGNRVKTSSDSTALLTFFDGSTLKLEPGTDIEIEQLESSDDQQTITIVLKQWMGESWSHVVKMADQGSHYEIKTPSAVALVRGTQFLIEVDNTGETKVLTTEGLVSVSAQGEEIFLPVGQQTVVEMGTPPSEPESVDVTEYITSQENTNHENNRDNSSQSENQYNPLGDGPDFGPSQDFSGDSNHAIPSAQNAKSSHGNGNGNTKNQTMAGNGNKKTSQGKANSHGNGKSGNQPADGNQDNDPSPGNGNGQDQSNGQGNEDAGNQPAEGNQDNDPSPGNGNGQGQNNSQGNEDASNQPAEGSQDNNSSPGNGNSQGNGKAKNQPAGKGLEEDDDNTANSNG